MVKNSNKTPNNDQTNVLIHGGRIDQHDIEASDQGAKKKMSRRTITIDERNERNLNQLRGRLLTMKNRELDYTSAVNMVMSIGFNRLAGDLTEKEYEIANKYIFGSILKIDAIEDEHWNHWIENEYPKMIKRLQRLEKKKPESNSVKEKKKADIPEQE